MDRFTKREGVLLGALIVLAGLLFLGRQTRDLEVTGLSEPVAAEEESSAKADSMEELEGQVVVHIAGEVFEPGVYALRAGARVVEAIQAAGGETNFADMERLNLARQLVDGEQIRVPSILDTAENAVEETGSVADGKVNINKADEATLESLTGIGPVKAQAIVEYRKAHPFSSIEEITSVSGIGEKTFEKIRDQITIN